MRWTLQRKISTAVICAVGGGFAVNEGLLLRGGSEASAQAAAVVTGLLAGDAVTDAETLLQEIGADSGSMTLASLLEGSRGQASRSSLFALVSGEPLETVDEPADDGRPRVTGVMRSGGVEAAVINGSLLRVGEARDGIELVSIAEESVMLRLADGGIVTVETPTGSERGIRGVEPGRR